MTAITVQNWIDNSAQEAVSGNTLANLDPARHRQIGTIPASNGADVELAAQAAHSALLGPWGQLSHLDRARILQQIADAIQANQSELAHLESLDTGKPIRLTSTIDIPRAAANFRFFAEAIRHETKAMNEMPDAINYTLRQPIGVVGLITPWNLPLYLLTWKLAPALGMGNTIVAKPSEMTPLSAFRLAQICAELDLLPKGVLNLVNGSGPEAGQAILEHPLIKAISFTGGTATGRIVAKTAAALLKKVSLELGGKNPSVVFADADLDLAVPGTLRAAFMNQGQVCLCGSRILVHESIYSDYLAKFKAQAQKLVIGNPQEPKTQFGSLISKAHRDKVASYVELAKGLGGTLEIGGQQPDLGAEFKDGAFFAPTVMTGLEQNCRVIQEEIFGPVVTVQSFASDEQALGLANGVEYGLSASVWTSNLKRALRFSAQLESGMVWVNTWLHRDLRVPFGGIKNSGLGREGGPYSLEFFSHSKNICLKL